MGTEARYIGMIGRRKKIQTGFNKLAEEGMAAGNLAAVLAPIGLDVGALTPEEIALRIVAEMIQDRRKGKGREA